MRKLRFAHIGADGFAIKKQDLMLHAIPKEWR